jgi:hypothetical protein
MIDAQVAIVNEKGWASQRLVTRHILLLEWELRIRTNRIHIIRGLGV